MPTTPFAGSLRALLLVTAALIAVLLPQPREGLAAGVTAVSAGSDHTCAVTGAGHVYCWGSNAYGQLGDGTTTSRATPTEVAGLENAVDVAAGGRHTCAVTSDGTVKCWGDNSQGQLGDGRVCGCLQPVTAQGLSDAVAVTAGFVHTCALTSAGEARCWGNNFHGQIGNSQIGGSVTVPAYITLGGPAAQLAAGDWHTCAVLQSGAAKCWGENLHGQIGNGVFGVNQPAPASVVGLGGGVARIDGGERHTCAVTNAGATKCWGRNDFGQLGTGAFGGLMPAPVAVSGLGEAASDITAGGNHTCVVVAGGGTKCWGANGAGQLGDGSTTGAATPVAVLGLEDVGAITGGARHTCALGTTVWCWGSNAAGQLGDGLAGDSAEPVNAWPSKGPVGKILFVRVDGASGTQLYVTDDGGEGAIGPAGAVDYLKTDWSVDGAIAFSYQGEIYVLPPAGDTPIRLTNDSFQDVAPAWSPDGARLAFQRMNGGDWDIYVMQADGTAQTNLTNTSGADVWPAWSPDGSRLAFSSTRASEPQVFLMDAGGGGQAPLTAGLLPSWSPDGERIAFSRSAGDGLAIHVIDADGGNELQLTDGFQSDLAPNWSPDGARVAFMRAVAADADIYIVSADGGEPVDLTSGPALDGWPVWQPAQTGGGSGAVGGVAHLPGLGAGPGGGVAGAWRAGAAVGALLFAFVALHGCRRAFIRRR